MARLRDIKVGQKVEIVKGKTPIDDFAYGFDIVRFIGCSTTVEHIDYNDPYCTVRTGEETECYWFPVDWIKIIKDEKEKPVKTEKTTEETKVKYAAVDVDGGGISNYFEDINQVFDVMVEWEGYNHNEVVELFEKGHYKIIEVKELDVKIELPKPVIKIVG